LCYYLATKDINPSYAKLLLILFVVVGVIVTTFIIKGSIMPEVRLSYSIASISAGLIFNLDFKEKKL